MEEEAPLKKPTTWVQRTVDRALKFNRLFAVTSVIAAMFFSYMYKKESTITQNLSITNAFLLAQNRSGAKAINETPLVWWKKEVFPETGRIIMMDYNDAFYDYMLKHLNVGRYAYIRYSDHEFFPEEVADVFYKEDFNIYLKYMAQLPDSDGHRPLYIEDFDEHWVDLQGNINKDGYSRWALEVDGHYFVYGILKKVQKKKRKKPKKKKVSEFIKPEDITIKDLKQAA